MPVINQKGVSSLIVTFAIIGLLILGIIINLQLVSQRTNLNPEAHSDKESKEDFKKESSTSEEKKLEEDLPPLYKVNLGTKPSEGDTEEGDENEDNEENDKDESKASLNCDPKQFDPTTWEVASDECRDKYSPNERRIVYECGESRKVVETPNDPTCVAESGGETSQGNAGDAISILAGKIGKSISDTVSFVQREFLGNVQAALDWFKNK